MQCLWWLGWHPMQRAIKKMFFENAMSSSEHQREDTHFRKTLCGSRSFGRCSTMSVCTLNKISVHMAFPCVMIGSWSSPFPSQQSSSTHLTEEITKMCGYCTILLLTKKRLRFFNILLYCVRICVICVHISILYLHPDNRTWRYISTDDFPPNCRPVR